MELVPENLYSHEEYVHTSAREGSFWSGIYIQSVKIRVILNPN